MFFNFNELDSFFVRAADKYVESAPNVVKWLDVLSIALSEHPEQVSVRDLVRIQQLYCDDCWMLPTPANNFAYKAMEERGEDTTGWLDF